MPKKKLKVKPLGGREAAVVPPRARPRKKMTKAELEGEFQKMVEKKWAGKQISRRTYEFYSSPTRRRKTWGMVGAIEFSKAKAKKKKARKV